MAKYNSITGRQLIEEYLVRAWDTDLYPIYFQHQSLDPNEQSEVFLRFRINNVTTSNDTFTGDGAGTNALGTISVFIYVKKRVPSHKVEEMINLLDVIFNNTVLDSGSFYFNTSSSSYGDTAELNKGYNQTNWSISFIRK